jgi:hypothetical protein
MARIWEDSFRCPFENINTTASRLAVLSAPYGSSFGPSAVLHLVVDLRRNVL